jgi:hypothetical protein
MTAPSVVRTRRGRPSTLLQIKKIVLRAGFVGDVISDCSRKRRSSDRRTQPMHCSTRRVAAAPRSAFLTIAVGD